MASTRRVVAVLLTLGIAVAMIGISPAAQAANAAHKQLTNDMTAQKALTRCQLEMPYSVSLIAPRVAHKGGDEYWAYGRIKLWDNDMDNCNVRVCIQQQESNSSWYSATSCWNMILDYEGAPTIYESQPLRFLDCSSYNRYRDNVRSFARNQESSAGSGNASGAVDVCPSNAG